MNDSSHTQLNLDITNENCDPSVECCSPSLIRRADSTIEAKIVKEEAEKEDEEEELRKLLLPNVDELPETPRSAVEANFITYFAPGTKNVKYCFLFVFC